MEHTLNASPSPLNSISTPYVSYPPGTHSIGARTQSNDAQRSSRSAGRVVKRHVATPSTPPVDLVKVLFGRTMGDKLEAGNVGLSGAR